MSITFTDLPRTLTVCNLRSRVVPVAVTLVGGGAKLELSEVEVGEIPPATGVELSLDLPAGACQDVRLQAVAGATQTPGKIEALIVARSATDLARVPVSVSVAAATAPPSSALLEKVTLRAEGGSFLTGDAALDSDAAIPLALGTDAAKVAAPKEGETIGVLTLGARQAALVAGTTRVDDGIVLLDVTADGLEGIGTFSGTAQLAGGEKPVAVKVDIQTSDNRFYKYGAVGIGLILGLAAILILDKWWPRNRLADQAQQISTEFPNAVGRLNAALGRPAGDRFEVDAQAVAQTKAEALAALAREQESSFLVDRASAPYKAAVEQLDRAKRDRTMLTDGLAPRLLSLASALAKLASAFPPPPSSEASITEPAFAAELRGLMRGQPLAVGSGTSIAASADSGLTLIAQWTQRAERWDVLHALAESLPDGKPKEAARTSLASARDLLVAAPAGPIDATAVDKELGTAWAKISLAPATSDERFLAPSDAAELPRLPIPGFQSLIGVLARPLGALAAGSATLLLAVSAVIASYLAIETTLADDTFGTFSDYVTALGLSGIASGTTLETVTGALNRLPRQELPAEKPG